MKKNIALVLSCALLLAGCGQRDVGSEIPINTPQLIEQTVKQKVVQEAIVNSQAVNSVQDDQENNTDYLQKMHFKGLDDQDLHQYVEDTLYNDLVARIDSEVYFIENIDITYISKEYIDELAYNSQANIYFGYTLEELNEIFQGERYVFTLGEEGETIVIPFETYDNTYEEVIKNVAIGSGVILICVTVSVVSAGVGAPAVSVLFAASAKTATAFAVSSAGLGAVTEGIFIGIQTGDMDEAIEAAVLVGSEEFKWGAITGAVAGGASKLYEISKTSKVGSIPNKMIAFPEKVTLYTDNMLDIAGKVDEKKMSDLRLAIQKGEFNTDEIALISKKMADLGITKAYEIEMKNVDFGKYLRAIGDKPPEDMVEPHAHHILFKIGNRKEQQALVEEGQALLRKYGIDPIVGPENLVWAPNKIEGQHSIDRLEHVVNKLKEVDKFGGTKEKIAEMLKQLGEEAAVLK